MTSLESTTGPFQGYKQVEEFGPDEEYEDGEEEFYVTLDLGSVDQTLLPSSSSYRLIVRRLSLFGRNILTLM